MGATHGASDNYCNRIAGRNGLSRSDRRTRSGGARAIVEEVTAMSLTLKYTSAGVYNYLEPNKILKKYALHCELPDLAIHHKKQPSRINEFSLIPTRVVRCLLNIFFSLVCNNLSFKYSIDLILSNCRVNKTN